MERRGGERRTTDRRGNPGYRPGSYPTPRQLQVLGRLAAGLTAKEAAQALGITHHTVRQQVMLAKRRVGARTTPQLLALAVERGWLLRG